jgi:hypothetical protein
MNILLAGTIEFVHIEQVPALFTFQLRQVLLYFKISKIDKVHKPSGSVCCIPPSEHIRFILL